MLQSDSPPIKPKIVNPLSDEFDISRRSVSTKELPDKFTSPPLMEGLLESIHGVLGPDARPTPIQALSLKHLFNEPQPSRYHEHLLASETGSGKSIAYLLPMLHDLKQSELNNTQRADPDAPRRAVNPRAIVLAPTHELTRQLSGFAKELLHHVKLRVLCASRANTASRKNVSAAKMADVLVEGSDGELEVSSEFMMRADQIHPVDIVVGTPAKILELMRGRGWDHEAEEVLDKRPRRKVTVGEPQMGLGRVEWVVVDEADVLFDPDFQEATRSILAEVSNARGHPVPFDPNLDLSTKGQPTPISYPFNFVLTSATIPSSLAAFLDKFHPSLTRLASPNLHKLPSSLKTEHFSWTGGNRDADIEHRLRRVWYEDMEKTGTKSKVLVFCNKSARVENLGAYLREKGIANVALTSAGDARKRGSNHHLDGFLRVRSDSASAPAATPATGAGSMDDLKEVPHVMITTSLLSRGLDFSPDVKHVFIVDEPRNMVDFLHRAGRSGRAGESGKVVVFGKSKGRGSEKARVVRKKVGALAA
ncbi:P-loop containing nucleoside triphosphate hydrolase protein [Dichomitus squalens]|uniref:RNA helicase n=1 Tax=Dichomitus squalens TaxID=114155 RepID=A0A4Q9PLL3_9APHY|nr:P-loop containing nucleoside triphosphate hydrolase protein [Dichomitus squalens]TBU55016.1 P-loop containing nucleoside triphosphate hydrolase protein [Dichomitus squalens]